MMLQPLRHVPPASTDVFTFRTCCTQLHWFVKNQGEGRSSLRRSLSSHQPVFGTFEDAMRRNIKIWFDFRSLILISSSRIISYLHLFHFSRFHFISSNHQEDARGSTRLLRIFMSVLLSTYCMALSAGIFDLDFRGIVETLHGSRSKGLMVWKSRDVRRASVWRETSFFCCKKNVGKCHSTCLWGS